MKIKNMSTTKLLLEKFVNGELKRENLAFLQDYIEKKIKNGLAEIKKAQAEAEAEINSRKAHEENIRSYDKRINDLNYEFRDRNNELYCFFEITKKSECIVGNGHNVTIYCINDNYSKESKQMTAKGHNLDDKQCIDHYISSYYETIKFENE